MRVKVDFGRVFPGILILLIGVAVFVVWLVLAVISFFFFFVPSMQGVFYFALNILLASLVLIVVGGLVLWSGVSGWTGTAGEGWFSRLVSARAVKDRLRASERIGELVGIFISLLIFLFLYGNQVRGVAFFTAAFGPTEQVLFYGPLVTGAVISLARAGFGRRNSIRPLDSLQAVLLTFAAFYFLTVFPFDFTHLADMFPESIRFIFGWLTDDVGRLVFIIAGVAGVVNSMYTTVLYLAVKDHLTRIPSAHV